MRSSKNSKEILKVILVIIIIKIIFFLLAYWLFAPSKVFDYMHQYNFSYPKDEKISFLVALKNWDGQHYTYLSQKWYKPNQDSNAFFPLFPFTISLSDLIIRSPIISGLFVSSMFSIVGFTLFFLVIKKLFSNKTAWLSLLLILIFPTAFYFHIPYSESLFLMLATLTIYLALNNKFKYACLISFFLPLTKLLGLLIIIPLFLIYIKNKNINLKKIFQKPTKYKDLLYLTIPIVGILVYFLIMKYYLGNFLVGFEAQKDFICNRQFLNWQKNFDIAKSFFNPKSLQMYSYNNGVTDRIAIIFVLAVIYIGRKKIPSWMWWYLVLFSIVPLLSGSTMSYIRFVLVAFPLFIIFAILLKNIKWYYQASIFLFLAIIQIIFISRFINFLWVA